MHKASGLSWLFFSVNHGGILLMYFIGIDVSKAKLDCSLLLEVASGKRRAKAVANSRAGIEELLAWCAKQRLEVHELHAILESTGVYHEQAALALADAGVTVSIVNPAQVKDFGRSLGIRTKTDGIDSQVLARYGALLNPRPWQPPAQEARALQALLSQREAIAQDLQRERNRLEKAGATDTPASIHQSLVDSIAFLEQQLSKLQQDIDDHIDQHPQLKADRDLLVSIPGVGPQVGNQLLAVMHTHRFQSAEQLAAYLGLVPVERASRGLPCLDGHAYPRPVQPASVLCFIWPQSLALATTLISKPFISVCKRGAKPKWPR
jgi:transposase